MPKFDIDIDDVLLAKIVDSLHIESSSLKIEAFKSPASPHEIRNGPNHSDGRDCGAGKFRAKKFTGLENHVTYILTNQIE